MSLSCTSCAPGSSGRRTRVTAITECDGAQPVSWTLGPAAAAVPVVGAAPLAPAPGALPEAEALAAVSHTPSGRTRARPRVRRSQSMRPSASCRTDCTRVALILLKSPYGPRALARASACAVSALVRATWLLRELTPLTVST